MISEATQSTIDLAEPPGAPAPAFANETGFRIVPPAGDPPGPAGRRKKGGPGRGHKGPMKATPRPRAVEGAPAPAAVETPAEPVEPSKSLVRGCRWMLRNIVLVMKEGYGWEEPEDYEEWLIEASQLSAVCVQKHFPDWMDRWGDEILLCAMLLLWATPNVSRKLRERKKPNIGDAGTEGKREDNPTLSLAKPA